MSQSNANPPWLNEESHEPLKTQKGYNTEATLNSNNEPRRTLFIFWILKGVTMLLCVLMFATAIFGLRAINGVDSVGKIFIGVYMMFFSTLLFVFELVEIKPMEVVDHFMRRNFGFLYGAMGKAFFIIFIAFLSFGLGDPETLTMVTGVSLSAFGLLEVALYLKYPELFESETK